jgi:hypothetical protein
MSPPEMNGTDTKQTNGTTREAMARFPMPIASTATAYATKKETTTMNSAKSTALRVLLAIAATLMMVGCAADTMGEVSGETLQGADESSVAVSEISASYPIGTTLATTANLNLRTGPSTGYRVILVMANGSRVVTTDYTTPRNGFYKVRYGGHEGWSYGGYLRLVSVAGGGGSSGGSTNTSLLDRIFDRARAGVGFAYWWGHGRWLASGPTSSTRSACYGSCPSCSHGGSYGADCSGFVGKTWIVPGSNSDLSHDYHPYSTWNFYNTPGGGQWRTVSRSSARHGDAFVYNSGSEGHIFLFDHGDAWGSLYAYEAPGCASGGGRIRHGIRTASSVYHVIRRQGL